ncbi:tape measure protein [Maribacter phage Molly_5]|uniref:Tape measure protein n=1 Tax=Maribacter phage Molly_1 TaxID=2745685 RepID=A0A8E4XZV1_9CAUD|nr:tape measure protein [Maribacter phage Molly_1]QQO97775.1 tape measure protein [Maribacter phage Molly_2]QQO97975.1 tape measure protein [Maribacter phage Molly_3]QQO98175.1 tape measure protein [Maribacter phage Molly_4]QQO98375.1 tape measure protein [Maribacter phage Molly_5]QQO97575.1 tape measure protein [Maribacter phage Molly_1]
MQTRLDFGIGFEHQSVDKQTRSLKRQAKVMLGAVSALVTMKKAGGAASKSIGSGFSSMGKRAGSLTKMIGNKLPGAYGVLLKGATKFASFASDSFDQLSKDAMILEGRYTRLANVLGSNSYATKVNKWQREQLANMPIIQDDLQDFTLAMNKFGIPPDLMNLKGVIEAGVGPANDFNNALSSMMDLANGGDIQAFQESMNFKVSAQEIGNALQGASTVQERMIAISNFYDKSFAGGVERSNRTIAQSMSFAGNIFQDFREAIIGEPVKGGFLYEVQQMFKDGVDYLRDNRKGIILLGKSISGVLTAAFKGAMRAAGPLVDMVKDLIGSFETSADTMQKKSAMIGLAFTFLGERLRWAFNNPLTALDILWDKIVGLPAKLMDLDFEGGFSDKLFEVGKNAGKWLWKGIKAGFFALMELGGEFQQLGAKIGAEIIKGVGLDDTKAGRFLLKTMGFASATGSMMSTSAKAQRKEVFAVERGQEKQKNNKSTALAAINSAMDKAGITDPSHRAYVLATAEHESNGFNAKSESSRWSYKTFQDLFGKRNGNDKISAGAYKKMSSQQRFGAAYTGILGNKNADDANRFKGRGYVQLTGRSNYSKATIALKKAGYNVDLVKNPELAERPDIAAFLLSQGMKSGSFTGKSLSDYGSGASFDAINARKTVNGMFHADKVSALYDQNTGGSSVNMNVTIINPVNGKQVVNEMKNELERKGFQKDQT